MPRAATLSDTPARISRAHRFAVAGMIALFSAALASAGQLDSELRQIIQRSRLNQCTIGVVIMDAQTGDLLASSDADDSFIPASNMKLFSSGAALAALGPDFSFQTTLELLPSVDTPVGEVPALGGRLVVRGSGDPAFADPELLDQMNLGVEDLLATWVKATKDAGVSEVGELIIDPRSRLRS
jgi:D-alanyl-D-alanine carboxypeptidase